MTGAPEMLGGRVKTLHPRLHGGILADLVQPRPPRRPGRPGHRGHRAGGVQPVPVPRQPLHRADRRRRPDHGASRGQELGPRGLGRRPGLLRRGARRAAPRRARSPTGCAAAWPRPPSPTPPPTTPPSPTGSRRSRATTCRRPSTSRWSRPRPCVTARTRTSGAPATARPVSRSWWDDVVQHGGMALSYLNLYDADAAWRLVHQLADLGPAAAVVVKHANPCGAAVADDLLTAYDRAFECDPMSAFGGIVALTAPVTEPVAAEMVGNARADVLIAPSFDAGRPRAVRHQAEEHAGPGRATARRRPVAPAPDQRRLAGPGPLPVRHRTGRVAGGHRGPADRRPVAGHGAGLAGVRRGQVQRHRAGRRRHGPRHRRRPAEPGHAGRDRHGPGRRAGPRAEPPPATPSSRSGTAWTRWPPPGWPPSSSPEARSATRRSSRPPTSTDWSWCSRGKGSSSIDGDLDARRHRSPMPSSPT